MSLSSVPEAITTMQGADNLVTAQHDVLQGVYETMGSVHTEVASLIEYFNGLRRDLEAHEMPSYKPAEIVETLGTLLGVIDENRAKTEELETHLMGIHQDFENHIVEAGSLIAGGQ